MSSGSENAAAGGRGGLRVRVGKYSSFSELARGEVLGRDYRVRLLRRASPMTVIAPHGGLIEDGTSELALAIAGNEHSVFCFEGLKAHGRNRELHITSHRFDHPQCLELVAESQLVLAVHGCRGESCMHLGGLDRGFVDALGHELVRAGFAVEANSTRYPGRHPHNICNRGARAAGAQLEVTYDLRGETSRAAIARAVRAAIEARRMLMASAAAIRS